MSHNHSDKPKNLMKKKKKNNELSDVQWKHLLRTMAKKPF